jgi:excisionase family DNA binding protein
MAEMEAKDLRDFIEPSAGETKESRVLWEALQEGRAPSDEVEGASDLERITSMELLKLTWPNGDPLTLPRPVQQVMLTAVRAMARGDGVAVVTAPNELTTGEAADLLGITRSYLVRLIDAGELPCHKTPKGHRRIRAEDVILFRRLRSFDRKVALQRHDEESENLGLH